MKDVKLGGGLQFTDTEIAVKVKKLVPEAALPKFGRAGDAGADLTAISMVETDMYIEYGTGIAMDIPNGYVGLIYPRSSLSNYDLTLSNHVGVIDPNFRGEIKFRFKRTKSPQVFSSTFYAIDSETIIDESKLYKIGDRIGQIILHKIPEVSFEEVTELDETNRGDGAYGSSGR